MKVILYCINLPIMQPSYPGVEPNYPRVLNIAA